MFNCILAIFTKHFLHFYLFCGPVLLHSTTNSLLLAFLSRGANFETSQYLFIVLPCIFSLQLYCTYYNPEDVLAAFILLLRYDCKM